jgi:hypothetical protein
MVGTATLCKYEVPYVAWLSWWSAGLLFESRLGTPGRFRHWANSDEENGDRHQRMFVNDYMNAVCKKNK